MTKDIRLNSFDDIQNYHGNTFDVLNVADGDTIYIDWPDNVARRGRTRIRLLGIDAPELENEKHQERPLAQEAALFLSDLLINNQVTVRLEDDRELHRDKYNRLLAYVFLAKSGKMINELMLENGLAWPDTRHEHKEQDRFKAISKAAFRAGKGIWQLSDTQIPAYIDLKGIME
ncbi:MAG: thermonuclease family protein [Sedimentisphaerales bacterium]|nr:thermonuclease family protein [Sedimentisphaerales bacterium]